MYAADRNWFSFMIFIGPPIRFPLDAREKGSVSDSDLRHKAAGRLTLVRGDSQRPDDTGVFLPGEKFSPPRITVLSLVVSPF